MGQSEKRASSAGRSWGQVDHEETQMGLADELEGTREGRHGCFGWSIRDAGDMGGRGERVRRGERSESEGF